MRGMRLFAVAAVVGAFAATAATAAASEPAFFECAKVASGAFTSKSCTVGGAGKFELKEGIATKRTFSAKSKTVKLDAKLLSMFCKAGKITGEYTSPTTVGDVVMTLGPCREVHMTPAVPCTSAGQKSGTVAIGPMSGTLGYVDKATKEVGMDFVAEGPGPLTELSCNLADTPEYRLTGSVFALRSGDIDTIVKKFALQIDEQGHQSFEGGGPNLPTLTELSTGEEQQAKFEPPGGLFFAGTGGALEVKA